MYSGKPTQEHSSFYPSIISSLGLKVKCIGHQILFVHIQKKCRSDSGFSLQFMISFFNNAKHLLLLQMTPGINGTATLYACKKNNGLSL